MAQEFSLGQQVIIEVDGKEMRGVVVRHERNDDGERVYYVSTEQSSEHGPFRLEQLRAG